MPNLPHTPESDNKTERHHNGLKWLLSLISALITTGLVVLINQHM